MTFLEADLGMLKARHVDGRFLWVQDKVAYQMLRVAPIEFASVDGRRSLADLESKVAAHA